MTKDPPPASRHPDVVIDVRDLQSLGDGELMDAVIDGVDDAFEEAYRRHADCVFATAKVLVHDDQLAQDTTQECFIRLLMRPESYDAERGSLRSYLLAHCHSRAIDLLRAEGARRSREVRHHHRSSVVEVDLAGDAIDRSTSDLTRRVLGQLPERERVPITLAFFGGVSYSQVAILLGVPEGTIKSRVRAGLRRMRAELLMLGVPASS